jgi:putative aldouronate transport system substrate-binding protein
MDKRALTAVLSAVLAVSAVACSSGGGGSAKEPSDASTNPNNEQPAGNDNKKYTITAIDFLFSGIPPKNGPGLQMINEKFNVDFQKDITVYSEYAQKLTTVISSGNILDIIGFETLDGKFYKWAEQGAFLELDDYIKDYPTLKMVAPDVWEPMKAKGKIYAIPRYFPATYLNSIVIRKDWLDNLGLAVPTNYDELKKVAIAFTKQDPDRNGKDDTYGLVLGQNINPNYAMGPYWDTGSWYHKDANGNFIPGFISEQRKELTQWLADLYKEGAVTKDFAFMNPTQYNAEFYSGKGGIYLGSPRGMNEEYMKGLVKIHPDAKIIALPPFKAPDGSQGFIAGSGYYTALALSAKLKDNPDKVRRILEMIDYGRQFIPLDQRNSKNEMFDWLYGKEGVGYTIQDGKVANAKPEDGLQPIQYMPDNKMWAPNDIDNQYSKTYVTPQLVSLVEDLEKVHSEYKHYINPIYQVNSPTYFEKAGELYNKLTETQSKMITGAVPISDWDKMVDEFLKNGGEQIIKEVNEGIKQKGYERSWK